MPPPVDATYRGGPPAVELRSWQKAALRKWLENDMRGIVRVVTGAGKTIFAETCMHEFLAKNGPSGQALVIVPTLALLDQWFVSLREDMDVEPNEVAVYSGLSKPNKPARFNLMTLNTARTMAAGVRRGRPTFLIVDECHRIGSPINKAILGARYAATLGVSATPEREYDDAFLTDLVPGLGRVIFEYGYSAARADQVISPFELINVAVEMLPNEQEQYARHSRRIARLYREGATPDAESLKRALLARAGVVKGAAMRVPAAVRLVERHPHERVIVFHEQVAAADTICRALAARHRNATTYHYRLDPALRRDNLRLFRKGLFDVLVTCRALDEGLNVPETSVAVIASAASSVRQRVQRLGRVLRPAVGKETAVVYTVYATESEEQRLLQEASGVTGAERVSWLRLGRKTS
jgi:superfamily II DNA or RNA helicase